MSPETHIKNGDPVSAKKVLMGLVRDDPANVNYRIFLFQLCCVLGEYDRALNQLGVISEMSDSALPMVQAYRELLQCEWLRQSVFAGSKTPLFFGEPEPWVGDIFQSLKLHAQGDFSEAQALRLSAYDQIEAVSGRINDQEFDWIADADSRIGPLLEAVIDGKYYWLPMHRVTSIDIEAPEDLRDFVWLPAQFTWTNGGQSVGFIPTRYPGSEAIDDGQIQTARKTEWEQVADDVYTGYGQRMLTTNAGDYALLDVRKIEFNPIA
ncbi:MAG: virulence protein SciE type [Gammaproteobacteria bacterium]|nr:MAG: virulence protein SciE type [Gammaproteobacteria bacterium]